MVSNRMFENSSKEKEISNQLRKPFETLRQVCARLESHNYERLAGRLDVAIDIVDEIMKLLDKK